jgi:predicted transcriptional regulator
MIYGSVYSLSESASLNGVEPQEFDESLSFTEMGAIAVEESTRDWNNMMRAIALTELSYVMETGQELIYESVDFNSIKEKVIEWFKKLWAKIQGIAKTAIAKFSSYVKDGKDFINKYSVDIRDGAKHIPSGFSFKGFDFKINPDSDVKAVKDAYDKIIDEKVGTAKRDAADAAADEEDFKDAQDEYRATIIGGSSNSVSASEFTTALKRKLRGGDTKGHLSSADIDVEKLIKIVENSKDTIDTVNKAKDAAKTTIDKSMRTVEKWASQFSNDASKKGSSEEESNEKSNLSKASAYYSRLNEHLKTVGNITASWFSTYISAVKDQNRQAKAICVKLIGYNNGVGAKKEAASILEDRFASIFN